MAQFGDGIIIVMVLSNIQFPFLFLVSLVSAGCFIPIFLFPLLILRKIVRVKLNKAIIDSLNEEIESYLISDDNLVKIKDIFEAPPIFLAVKKENEEAVKLLIKYGSKTKIKDSRGISLIRYAKATNNKDIIEGIEKNDI